MAENEGIKWYVVHTYSGYENKVKVNLEKAVENNGMQDKIVDVRIPMKRSSRSRTTSAARSSASCCPVT